MSEDHVRQIEEHLDEAVADLNEAAWDATLSHRGYMNGYTDALAYALSVLCGTTVVLELRRSSERIKVCGPGKSSGHVRKETGEMNDGEK